MRHEKALRLLDLARRLAATAEGLTLDEMAAALGRRPAHGRAPRDAVREIFPEPGGSHDPPTRRFRIPAVWTAFSRAPAPRSSGPARRGRTARRPGRGGAGQGVRRPRAKILGQLRGSARRRIAPDLEALVQAEAIAAHAGPRPFEDTAVLTAVRTAITALKALRSPTTAGAARPGARGARPAASSLAAATIWSPPRPAAIRFVAVRPHERGEVCWDGRPRRRLLAAGLAAESFGVFHGRIEDVVLGSPPRGPPTP